MRVFALIFDSFLVITLATLAFVLMTYEDSQSSSPAFRSTAIAAPNSAASGYVDPPASLGQFQ